METRVLGWSRGNCFVTGSGHPGDGASVAGLSHSKKACVCVCVVGVGLVSPVEAKGQSWRGHRTDHVLTLEFGL